MRFSNLGPWILSLGVFCAVSRGIPLVEAKMHYVKDEDGKKMFGAQWFAKGHSGVINMGLGWIRFNAAAQSRGFNLSKAASVVLKTPAVESGCQIKAKGALVPSSNGQPVNPLSLSFEGDACLPAFNHFPYTQPIEITFSSVPSVEAGGEPADVLILKIDGLPANDYGLQDHPLS